MIHDYRGHQKGANLELLPSKTSDRKANPRGRKGNGMMAKERMIGKRQGGIAFVCTLQT